MFKVYVLFSPRYQKIYIGYSSNFEERFKSHNELGTKGWTVNFRPWMLIHSEEFKTKQEALIKEKKLKGAKGRQWIWQLLQAKGLISA
jgi:putative endonuclease